jgi:hypothetical protein
MEAEAMTTLPRRRQLKVHIVNFAQSYNARLLSLFISKMVCWVFFNDLSESRSWFLSSDCQTDKRKRNLVFLFPLKLAAEEEEDHLQNTAAKAFLAQM